MTSTPQSSSSTKSMLGVCQISPLHAAPVRVDDLEIDQLDTLHENNSEGGKLSISVITDNNSHSSVDIDGEQRSSAFGKITRLLRASFIGNINNIENKSMDSKSRSGSILFQCEICTQSHQEAQSIGYGNCDKEHVFCRPCLTAYTRIQIESGIKNHPCPLIDEGID